MNGHSLEPWITKDNFIKCTHCRITVGMSRKRVLTFLQEKCHLPVGGVPCRSCRRNLGISNSPVGFGMEGFVSQDAQLTALRPDRPPTRSAISVQHGASLPVHFGSMRPSSETLLVRLVSGAVHHIRSAFRALAGVPARGACRDAQLRRTSRHPADSALRSGACGVDPSSNWHERRARRRSMGVWRRARTWLWVTRWTQMRAAARRAVGGAHPILPAR